MLLWALDYKGKTAEVFLDIKVEDITPRSFKNFVTWATPLANYQSAEAEESSIFMIGHGSFVDFAVKGYDVIGKVVASLDRIV